MDEPCVRPLTPGLLDDWVGFFEEDAFADNPEWRGCWCRCFLFGGGGFEAWDRACATDENRRAMIERIRAGAVDGMLAYRGGRAVGWVHHGPTARFHSPLARLSPAEEGLASIVCFIVSAAHRRTGVARALLRGACVELARAGFRAVDARPRLGQHAAAELFPGPLELYLAEGFTLVEHGPERARVRRDLTTKPG